MPAGKKLPEGQKYIKIVQEIFRRTSLSKSLRKCCTKNKIRSFLAEKSYLQQNYSNLFPFHFIEYFTSDVDVRTVELQFLDKNLVPVFIFTITVIFLDLRISDDLQR